MMQEHGNFSVQGEIVLTFLGMKACGFDPNSFPEASASQWNKYRGLNHLVSLFSVFNFQAKNSSVLFGLWRSFRSFCTRVSMCICI